MLHDRGFLGLQVHAHHPGAISLGIGDLGDDAAVDVEPVEVISPYSIGHLPCSVFRVPCSVTVTVTVTVASTIHADQRATRARYGAGPVATAPCASRMKILPTNFERRRLNRNVNSSR